MAAVIPRFQGSATHLLAVELYMRHADMGSGYCVRCGRPAPCDSRRHARYVLMAAGDHPDNHEPTVIRVRP